MSDEEIPNVKANVDCLVEKYRAECRRLNAKLEATGGLGHAGYEEALEELEQAEEELKMMYGLALTFEGWPSLPPICILLDDDFHPSIDPDIDIWDQTL